jgi:Ca-activated chloride channel homolog
MRRTALVLFAFLFALGRSAQLDAAGLLIPDEKALPPLAMLNHKVAIAIDDQVSTTRVEQTFRNHTDRQLEATYVFPVPPGASVNRFSMWVNGREVKGELVQADEARAIYNSIVRRTQDPGLLECIGADLLRLRVFPIPARGDQKVALHFTSVARREGGLVEYVYPLKTDGKATQTLDDFSITATIASQHGVENVYSPTHAITLTRKTDKQVEISFSRKNVALDRDFQLFYQLGGRDVGLTTLTHRPIAAEDGHFLMLISPQLRLAQDQQVPRDLVLVLDTSGSMEGVKMAQARKALKYFLERLNPGDRFGLLNFATTVTRYRDKLTEGDKDQVAQAKKWVDGLDATGGTNINDALASALEMRTDNDGRSFTVVFFTDGCPTVGETNPEIILKNTLAKNTANTRIFTFGVGDDVNATFLDRLADRTRAWASYVRPEEDIEVKVSSLHTKIAHPVLTNLKLETTADVKLREVYPPQLPDLFHGSQLIVLGRYTGQGPTAIKLTGKVGTTAKEFVYELTFPAKTGDERQLVEHLWVRRKVGYLLNEIRANGPQKELVDEVTKLARRHGIATPYTSYLVVPDGKPASSAKTTTTPGNLPNVGFSGQFGGQVGQIGQIGQIGGQIGQIGQFGGQFGQIGQRGGMGSGRTGAPGRPGAIGTGPAQGSVPMGQPGQLGFGGQFGQLGAIGGQFGPMTMPAHWGETGKTKTSPAAPTTVVSGKVLDMARALREAGFDGKNFVPLPNETDRKAQEEALRRLDVYLKAGQALAKGQQEAVQTGELGVNLSLEVEKLRQQRLLSQTGQRQAAGREFQLVAGIWLDSGFKEKAAAVVVQAQSDAYFRILERCAEARDVFRLGNQLVWMTPSGTALVLDKDGKTKLDDAEIDCLFVPAK